MAKALTVKTIEALRKGETRREIPDGGSAGVAGLFFIIQPSGATSWAFRYRSPIDRKTRKFTIGSYPALGLAVAREIATTAAEAVARKQDPAELKKAEQAKAADKSDVVSSLLTDFITGHFGTTRKSTATEAKRLVETIIRPAWGKKKIGSITKGDVRALLDGITKRGAGVLANRVFALVRLFFNWVIDKTSIIEKSPVAGIRAPTKEVTGDRTLTDEEIRWLWKATAAGGAFNSAIRILLLTGQRRSEVGGMEWAELSRDQSAWTIPPERTKNGLTHIVPLTDEIRALISSVGRIEKSRFVFTTSGAVPINGWSKGKEGLDARMLAAARQEAQEAGFDPDGVELADWRLHDLRRTAASNMARLKQPVEVVEAVLNHKSGKISGIAKIYNQHDYASEKADALTAWGNFVTRLVTQEPGSNVIPMRA